IIKNNMTAAEKISMDNNLLINKIWATLYTQRSNISDENSQFIDYYKALVVNNSEQCLITNSHIRLPK
ncbi:hypothetical protein, partial [Shewanella sp. 30m-9]